MNAQTEIERARQIRRKLTEGKMALTDALWMNETGNELLFKNGELERAVNQDTGEYYYYPKIRLTDDERKQRVIEAKKNLAAEQEREDEERING